MVYTLENETEYFADRREGREDRHREHLETTITHLLWKIANQPMTGETRHNLYEELVDSRKALERLDIPVTKGIAAVAVAGEVEVVLPQKLQMAS